MGPNSNLRNLDELRPDLAIPSTNTGKRIPLTTESGIVSDDTEGLIAMSDENGFLILQSGTEFTSHLYRGQPEEFRPCVPTLGRLKKTEEQLLALCRNAAFEEALSEHPFVQLSKQTKFLGHNLRVDTQGLAQHYGFATDLLDFTSNFEVATFFAVCYWDRKKREYRPVVDSEKIGVLYRIQPVYIDELCDGAVLETVGWQPIKRPEQQRAFGLKMKKGAELNEFPIHLVQTVRFRHCAKISNRIWKSFDKGQTLFPTDAVTELAKRAETLCKFTRPQVDKAWERLDTWNENKTETNYRLAVEGRSKINICRTTVLNWEGLWIERDEELLANQLKKMLDKILNRLDCYPLSPQ